MFYRKISTIINEYFDDDNDKILCIDGARQIGKSYIIRELASKRYDNYIELNMADDKVGDKRFENIKNINDFYLQVSISHGNLMGSFEDTIIFIDEIQVYPELITMLKALKRDNRFKYICSGSEFGLALTKTTLIPMGSIHEVKMYPMDFEEFLLACGVNKMLINYMYDCFKNKKALDIKLHEQILSLFKTYLYVGGLPDSVSAYVNTKNVYRIRQVQEETMKYYAEDASKYDKENKLKIKRIYDMLSSNIENKVKRIMINEIENKTKARFKYYQDEFDYLISSGISLATKAISEPKFPLIQSSNKNLIKLYYNDVGLLTNVLYKNNINAILEDKKGINLGAVYETVVAQELKAHGHNLFYYDRKSVGEVDFLIDDYENLCITPIEIKSGSDERNFKALPKILNDNNYKIEYAYVFSNEYNVVIENKIVYMPIYYIMFM